MIITPFILQTMAITLMLLYQAVQMYGCYNYSGMLIAHSGIVNATTKQNSSCESYHAHDNA